MILILSGCISNQTTNEDTKKDSIVEKEPTNTYEPTETGENTEDSVDTTEKIEIETDTTPTTEKITKTKVIQLTNNQIEEKEPILSGDYIIYYVVESGDLPNSFYLLDTKTDTNKFLTKAGNYLSFDFQGDNLVWSDKRNGNADIFIYNIKTNKESQVTDNKKDQIYPRLFGNKVVWHDNRNLESYSADNPIIFPNWDIYSYDILKNNEESLVSASQTQYYPAIWENFVVWEDGRHKTGSDQLIGGDIYLLDLSNGKEVKITSTKKSIKPLVNNRYVVYTDYRNNKGYSENEIFLYDINKEEEIKIFENERNSKRDFNIDISNDYVVWKDENYGDSKKVIYIYSIKTGKTNTLEDTNTYKPNADNNQLVFTNKTNGKSEIFLLEILQ